MKKIIVIIVLCTIIGIGGYSALNKMKIKKIPNYTTVPVKRGTIIAKALAVGKILPKDKIAVKSAISGIAREIFVNVGDNVKPGTQLFDISPNPTPEEYAIARNSVEMEKMNFQNATRDFERISSLFQKQLIAQGELDKSKQILDAATLRLDLAQEKFDLLEKGRVKSRNQKVENIIRSPTEGMILEINVHKGDPVVPLTSYQAGTELMTIANMDKLIFRGTVDEIDVGKLKVGMPATIRLGANPQGVIQGTISFIAPQSKVEQNATVFEVEISLIHKDSTLLRAGYSANADIIIQKKDSIMIVPERLITFEAGSTFVEIEGKPGEPVKQYTPLGISDGINVEVLSGLKDNQQIISRPPKKLMQ